MKKPSPLDLLKQKQAQRPELTPETVDTLVAAYQVFQSEIQPKTDVVYYPCSATDVSPSVAFPRKSRVIYVDKDSASMTALQKAGFETHIASALDFEPGAPVDVLILMNPGILPEKPSQTVKEDGYILCNNYHRTADILKDNDHFALVGTLRRNPENNQDFFDRDKLEDYWNEVETEDEFKAARPGIKGIDYKRAAEVVEKLTGKTENILAEYKQLISLAKAEKARLREEQLRSIEATLPQATLPGGEDEGPFISYRGQDLDTRLPKKKGFPIDIFVFQKIKKKEAL